MIALRLALLVMACLPLVPAPRAAAEELRASDIEVDGTFGHLRIPSLEASGTKLSGKQIARLIDPVSRDTLQRDLAEASAQSIRIPHLTIAFGAGDQRETLTLDGVELSGIDKGRIADVRIAKVSAGGGPGIVPFSTAALTSRDLDLGLLLLTMNGAAPDTRSAPRALFANLALDNLSMGREPFSVRSIVASQVRIRGPSHAAGEALRPLRLQEA